MAQWVRTVAALSDDPGLIPSTYKAAYICLYVVPVPGESDILTQTFMQAKQQCTQFFLRNRTKNFFNFLMHKLIF